MLIVAAALGLKKWSFTVSSELITTQVTKKYTRNGKNGNIYELKVAYNVNGTNYEKYLRTSLWEFNRLKEGDPFELLYKPRNPHNVLRPDAMDKHSIYMVLSIGIGMTVVGLALFLTGQI